MAQIIDFKTRVVLNAPKPELMSLQQIVEAYELPLVVLDTESSPVRTAYLLTVLNGKHVLIFQHAAKCITNFTADDMNQVRFYPLLEVNVRAWTEKRQRSLVL